MDKLTLKDVELRQELVFVRVDFNVPIQNAAIADDQRIRAALPSLRYLINAGAKLVIASHLGRPKGKADPRYSLQVVAEHLAALLECPVTFLPDVTGSATQRHIAAMQPGNVALLENLRFDARETANDADFSAHLARGVAVYVNDAFGTAHRAHASTEGITHHVPVSVMGLLVEAELQAVQKALDKPATPLVLVLGGAKVSDKLPVIEALLPKVDKLCIGGGMAYTFLKAQGVSIGKSLVETDRLADANRVMEQAKERGLQLLLPSDHRAAAQFNAEQAIQLDDRSLPDHLMGLDIGPLTGAEFERVILGAGTVIWNGPMGVFEKTEFAAGTNQVANAIARSSAYSLVGGGDSLSALSQAGLIGEIDHVSTGGGATLELLSGKHLPGIVALSDRRSV